MRLLPAGQACGFEAVSEPKGRNEARLQIYCTWHIVCTPVGTHSLLTGEHGSSDKPAVARCSLIKTRNLPPSNSGCSASVAATGGSQLHCGRQSHSMLMSKRRHLTLKRAEAAGKLQRSAAVHCFTCS